jgi:hypothetical protein
VRENHLEDAMAATKEMGRELEWWGCMLAFHSKDLRPGGAEATRHGNHPETGH